MTAVGKRGRRAAAPARLLRLVRGVHGPDRRDRRPHRLDPYTVLMIDRARRMMSLPHGDPDRPPHLRRVDMPDDLESHADAIADVLASARYRSLSWWRVLRLAKRRANLAIRDSRRRGGGAG